MDEVIIERSGKVRSSLQSINTYNGDVDELDLIIRHPDFTDAAHYLYVRQQGLSFRVNIDYNDIAIIPVAGAGMMSFQYVAINKYSSSILFLSDYFKVVIRKSYATTDLIFDNYHLGVLNREFITSLKTQNSYYITSGDADSLTAPGYYFLNRAVLNLPSGITQTVLTDSENKIITDSDNKALSVGEYELDWRDDYHLLVHRIPRLSRREEEIYQILYGDFMYTRTGVVSLNKELTWNDWAPIT